MLEMSPVLEFVISDTSRPFRLAPSSGLTWTRQYRGELRRTFLSHLHVLRSEGRQDDRPQVLPGGPRTAGEVPED